MVKNLKNVGSGILEKSLSDYFLGGVWSQDRNLKKLTERHTRSGTCGSIWPNAGKLTRIRQEKDWQFDSAFLIFWVVVHGRWWLVIWIVWLISKTNEIIKSFSRLSKYVWGSFFQKLIDWQEGSTFRKSMAITGLWCPSIFWASRELQ